MFGYTCTIYLFPHALQGFAAEDLKALELGSTKREEDLHISGKWPICYLAFPFGLGKYLVLCTWFVLDPLRLRRSSLSPLEYIYPITNIDTINNIFTSKSKDKLWHNKELEDMRKLSTIKRSSTLI